MDEAAEDDLAASKLPSEPSVEDAVVAVANPDSLFHDVCVINYNILAFRLALGGAAQFSMTYACGLHIYIIFAFSPLVVSTIGNAAGIPYVCAV